MLHMCDILISYFSLRMLSVVLLLLLPPYLDTVYVVAEDEEHFSRISLKETTEKVYSMYDKNSRPPGCKIHTPFYLGLGVNVSFYGMSCLLCNGG